MYHLEVGMSVYFNSIFEPSDARRRITFSYTNEYYFVSQIKLIIEMR